VQPPILPAGQSFTPNVTADICCQHHCGTAKLKLVLSLESGHEVGRVGRLWIWSSLLESEIQPTIEHATLFYSVGWLDLATMLYWRLQWQPCVSSSVHALREEAWAGNIWADTPFPNFTSGEAKEGGGGGLLVCSPHDSSRLQTPLRSPFIGDASAEVAPCCSKKCRLHTT